MLIKLIPEWKSHFDCLIPIGCYSKSQMGGVRLKNFLRSFEVDITRRPPEGREGNRNLHRKILMVRQNFSSVLSGGSFVDLDWNFLTTI